MPENGTKYYAIWVINSYKIDFISEGTTIHETKNADYNTDVEAPATNPSKTGYSFKGWATTAGVTDPSQAVTFPVKMPENMRMCLETPNARIVFVYNPEYQQLRNLCAADAVFGLPEYAQPLRTYLKRGAVEPTMGLREWVVAHEHACKDHQQYIRQDVASTLNAAAVTRGAELLAKAALNIVYGRPKFPEIKAVHFSGPVTCVIWDDGTKTLVRCSENDYNDPEKGLAMAIAKKALGNNGSYYDTFKKWVPVEEPLCAECEATPDE
jgi:uncharacterized repeat protein (TIGR02543 family)